MRKYDDGSWDINLNGICYRELWELGELLAELGDKGSLDGVEYDLGTLRAGFNASNGNVYLYDADGNISINEE